MKKRIIVGAGLAALAFTVPASAQDTYVSGQFGLTAVEDIDGSMAGGSVDLELANASFFAVAIGRQSGHWRFEGELANRAGKFNALTLNGVDTGATGDGLSARSLMANAVYEFAPDTAWSPYVGAGLGLAQVRADFTGAGGQLDGSATALAVQLIGGLNYQLADNTSVYFDMRYLRAAETDHDLSASLGGATVSFQYDGYALGFGLRRHF